MIDINKIRLPVKVIALVQILVGFILPIITMQIGQDLEIEIYAFRIFTSETDIDGEVVQKTQMFTGLSLIIFAIYLTLLLSLVFSIMTNLRNPDDIDTTILNYIILIGFVIISVATYLDSTLVYMVETLNKQLRFTPSTEVGVEYPVTLLSMWAMIPFLLFIAFVSGVGNSVSLYDAYPKSEDTESFVEIDNVTRIFRDPETNLNIQVLRGIDMRLKPGSFTSIIGPSGAGKSTLLGIIGGMIKPTTGKIYVDGSPLHLYKESALTNYRRNVCGFLWQDAEMNLQPRLTVTQNIQHAMKIANYPRSVRENRTNELLRKVGLTDRSKHRFGQLSGGEAMRASLAVSLANEPKLLLLDEPTGELDSETTIEMIDYLREMNRDEGTTIFVVTHDNRFERMTQQSFTLIDGIITSLKRPKFETASWKDVVREEFTVINQFGQIQISQNQRSKYDLGQFVRLDENETDSTLVIKREDDKNI